MNWFVLLADCLRCPTEDNGRGCKHQSNLKKEKKQFRLLCIGTDKVKIKDFDVLQ